MKWKDLESLATAGELRTLEALKSPARVQEFIDSLRYRGDEDYICPLTVLRKREAHCFDIGPLSLTQFDSLHWRIRDEAMDAISDRLDWMREIRLLNRAQVRRLEPAGGRVYRAGLMDADAKTLYRP